MVTGEEIRTLYAYNRWANARALDSAAAATPERLMRPLGSSFASLHATLVHILAAERIWLSRWKGVSPSSMWAPRELPDFAALRARWSEVEREQSDFVARVDDDALAAPLAYINTRGERWEYPLGRTMQHVVNHSTYHRGQVAALLRQLGLVPAATDFLIYFDELGPR